MITNDLVIDPMVVKTVSNSMVSVLNSSLKPGLVLNISFLQAVEARTVMTERIIRAWADSFIDIFVPEF